MMMLIPLQNVLDEAVQINFFILHLRTWLLILERGKGKEKVRERNINMRERNTNWLLLYVPQPGTKTTTWACALTGNRTHDILIYGTMFQPIEPCQPGQKLLIFSETNPWVHVMFEFAVTEWKVRRLLLLTALWQLSGQVRLSCCFELPAGLVISRLMEHHFYLKELKFSCDRFPILKDFCDMISSDTNDVIFKYTVWNLPAFGKSE